MAKQIIFELKVLGTDQQIKTQNELADAIKAVNTELKKAELGGDAYRALEQELGNLKNAQKDVTDSQRLMQRELEAQGGATTRTYKSMNAELVNARALFRELTEEERKGERGQGLIKQITALDTELKDIDATIGNFQRNVGNYEGGMKKAFAPIQEMLGNSIPGFQQLDGAVGLFKSGIEEVGTAATSVGKIMTGAFIGIQVISLLLEGAKAVKQFTEETTKLRLEVAKVSEESAEKVKNSTREIIALSQTFGAEQNEIMNAANAVAKNYGVSFETALKQIESGFLAGANANGNFLDTLTEFSPKAKGAGASMDQFFVALTQAGQAGLKEDEVLEAIIKRSSEFTGAVGDMVSATDELTIKQKEQLDAEKELADAKVKLSEVTRALIGDTDTFWTRVQAKAINAALEVGNYITGKLLFPLLQLKKLYDESKNGAQSTADVSGNRDVYEGVAQQENKAVTIAQQVAAEAAAAAAKQKAAERKKIADERAKAQAEANAAEAAYMEERINLLNELNGRLAAVAIAGIQDLTAREIAEEKARFESVRAELATVAKEQEAAQLEARQKLAETYGPNSARVQEFDRRALADIQARREQANAIEQQELTAHLLKLEAIKNDAVLKQAENDAKRIETGINAISEAYRIQAAALALDVEKAVNEVGRSGLGAKEKGEIILKIRMEAEKSALQQSTLEITEQIDKIQARLLQFQEDDTLTNASVAEYNALSDQLDALLLKREQNESAYTEIVTREGEKRRGENLKELTQALEYSAQVVNVFDQFAKALYEKDMARIGDKEQANQASIERIEARLQTATGFQKQQLEQQLADEKAKEQTIAKEKERIQKEEGRRAKAFAVVQSIINTALAVTKALATANVAAAIFAGALGLVQTATILAQPAAKGAKIGSVPAVDTGLIVTPQNIPTLANGDNVLATVRRGEVVLNKEQQTRLGGAPTFRAIGVPGFAGGGMIGDTLGAPDLSGITNAERVKLLEENVKLLTTYTTAVNNRTDRLRTYVVSSDVSSDLNEGEAIKTLASLG